jgi:CBS domain-containing protein
MRARELAEAFPTVALDADLLTAARTMADQRQPGLIVCDREQHPYTVLPGSQALRYVVPKYIQEQPTLARAFDERAADELRDTLTRHTVRDVLPKPDDVDELPVVDGEATTLEVAALMVRLRSPLVAVIDGERVIGAITISRLLTEILPA